MHGQKDSAPAFKASRIYRITTFALVLGFIWLLLLTFQIVPGDEKAPTQSPTQEKELIELRNQLATLNEEFKRINSRMDEAGSVDSMKGDIDLFRKQMVEVLEGRGKLLETQKTMIGQLDVLEQQLQHAAKSRQLIGAMIFKLKKAISIIVLGLDGTNSNATALQVIEIFDQMEKSKNLLRQRVRLHEVCDQCEVARLWPRISAAAPMEFGHPALERNHFRKFTTRSICGAIHKKLKESILSDRKHGKRWAIQSGLTHRQT